MAVKLFQAREPAFQRLQLPLLLAQPHRTSFRSGRGGDRWFLVATARLQHFRKEGASLLQLDRENLNGGSHPYHDDSGLRLQERRRHSAAKKTEAKTATWPVWPATGSPS